MGSRVVMSRPCVVGEGESVVSRHVYEPFCVLLLKPTIVFEIVADGAVSPRSAAALNVALTDR
jgi:hypothetical protein